MQHSSFTAIILSSSYILSRVTFTNEMCGQYVVLHTIHNHGGEKASISLLVSYLASKMGVQVDDVELCETVLGELERGVELIRNHYPLESLSLETKEALVEQGTERLLEVSVLLEPLLSNKGKAITRQIVTSLEAIYEADIRRLVAGRHRGRPNLDIHENQLGFLIANSFRVTDIAALFGCSRRMYLGRACE